MKPPSLEPSQRCVGAYAAGPKHQSSNSIPLSFQMLQYHVTHGVAGARDGGAQAKDSRRRRRLSRRGPLTAPGTFLEEVPSSSWWYHHSRRRASAGHDARLPLQRPRELIRPR